jgi:hypothetical protein
MAHVPGHAGQVGWANAQPDLLPGAGGDRAWPVMRRAVRHGEGSGRTGNSPGTRRWGRLGRRIAGGGEFGGGGPRFPARKRRLRRRLRARRLDSFRGEVEDGAADLLRASAGLGRARDGGARWWPWRCLQVTGRKHKNKEGAREKKKGRGAVSWRR